MFVRLLSERVGDYTAVQQSESTTRGRTRQGGSGCSSNTKSQNSAGTRAALISIDEILSLTVDDAGNPEEQLLFIRGRRPLRCGLPKYFRRKEMAGMVMGNPYYRPPPKQIQWSKVGRQVAAGVYSTALLGLAGWTALLPLPLVAGDEVVVIGNRPAPAYWPETRSPAGTIPIGWQFRVTSANRRNDDFIEITGYGAQSGQVLRVLVHRDYLERQ